MTKVLLIAYFFPPTGGGGVQRALKFVQYLPEDGFAPTVLTGPASPDDHWAPQDRSLVGEIPGDVPVHRVTSTMPPTPGAWRRRLERWAPVSSSFSRWWVPAAVEAGERVAPGHDLILATMSPFSSGEVGRRLSERTGIPWVADLRDPWALDEMQVYPTAVHRWYERRRMERLLSTAALVVMNTPEAAAALQRELPGLRDAHVVTITNGYDSADFDEPLPPRSDTTFRIVHSGHLHADAGVRWTQRLLGGARSDVDIVTRSHSLLLEALERWSAARPEIADQVELVLAGRITDEDRRLVTEARVASMVRLLGYVSHAESVRLVRDADLLFLPMQNLPAGERSRIVPGKTYEYMAAGRPILAAVPEGDARDFVAGCGTALLCRPDDVEGMARLLDQAYEAWKGETAAPRSDTAFVARFERRHLTRILAVALRGVLSETREAAEDAGGSFTTGESRSLSGSRSR